MINTCELINNLIYFEMRTPEIIFNSMPHEIRDFHTIEFNIFTRILSCIWLTKFILYIINSRYMSIISKRFNIYGLELIEIIDFVTKILWPYITVLNVVFIRWVNNWKGFKSREYQLKLLELWDYKWLFYELIVSILTSLRYCILWGFYYSSVLCNTDKCNFVLFIYVK